MAFLSRSRLLLAILVVLVGYVLNRIRDNASIVAALPSKPWIPFENGSTSILFEDDLKYCENIVLDQASGNAIVSCDPGRGEWNTVIGVLIDPTPKGTLYIYNYLTRSSLRPITLFNHPKDFGFHPLGIAIFRSSPTTDTIRLFVPNHQEGGSTIDVFALTLSTASAKFITSISDGDNTIISPNSIAPISETEFYVTNDHRFVAPLRPILSVIETFTNLPLTWVTLVDFSTGTPRYEIVATGICYSNGIVISATGRELVVAATCPGRSKLFVYDRDTKTNSLSYREKIPMPFAADNLAFDEGLSVDDPTAFDEQGRFLRGLVTAGHPAPLSTLIVAKSRGNKTAPSWVVEVRRGRDDDEEDVAPLSAMGKGGRKVGKYNLRTLFQNDGTYYSTSTTGTVDFARKRLLVSGLYAKGLLDISW